MECKPTDKIRCLEKEVYNRMKELEISIPQTDGKWHDLNNVIDELHDFLFNDDRDCEVTNVYMPCDNCDRRSCCKDYDSDRSINNDDSEEMLICDDTVNNPVLPVNNIISNDNLETDNVPGNSDILAKPNDHVGSENDLKYPNPTERPSVGPSPEGNKGTNNDSIAKVNKHEKKSKIKSNRTLSALKRILFLKVNQQLV
ncbi:hypothetical protein AVEN_233540-1 [Araneus ventricosus]|uniref:Uncharacterized protein n=1 Tax=Araneus ventricosus TaxID=182803 RepID=A0A4Y2NAG6_ARAVE|nr:hypothetical protein AVEN_233540-1 [Araneus ventricosus]